MDIALLIARLVIGLGMAAHGAQKLFGWFGGHGLAGTGGFFDALGFRPGRVFAFLAGVGELGSGLLIALGLMGPVGPAVLILVMIVAIAVVHWRHGFLAMNNGIELPMLYAVAALALAFSGPGRYSLDALLGFRGTWNPTQTWLLVGAACVLAALNVIVRRPAASPAQTPTSVAP